MKYVLFLLLSLLINASTAAELEGSNISGFNFGYLDIEKNCTAKREGQDSLSIQCKGSELKAISRSCGGYITRGLESAKLNCGGSLWVLNQRCKIEMRGADHGELNCKL